MEAGLSLADLEELGASDAGEAILDALEQTRITQGGWLSQSIEAWITAMNCPPSISAFLAASDRWSRRQSAANADSSVFWKAVGFSLHQFDGARPHTHAYQIFCYSCVHI